MARTRGFCLLLFVLALFGGAPPCASAPLAVSAPCEMKAPVEELARAFEDETGARVQVACYDDAAREIGRLKRQGTGDLFIGDVEATLAEAERGGLVLHAQKPFFYKRLSLAVQPGNPRMIFHLADVARPGLTVGLARAGRCYLGDVTKETLSRAQLWERVRRNVVAEVARPNDLAALLVGKKVDVAIGWDTLELADLDNIVVMRLPWRVCESKAVPAAVLGRSQDKKLATRLLEFLASSRGHDVLFRHGYWPQSGKHGGRGMDRAARMRFARMYPLLAKQIVEDFGRQEGICLDIGCGPGQLLIEIAKISPMAVWGVDIEPQTLEIARGHAAAAEIPEAKLRFVVGDVHNLPLPDDFAELIVSRGSAPFWRDKPRGFREIYRVLRPGGVAFIGGGFSRYLSEEEILEMKPNWAKRGKGGPPAFRTNYAQIVRAAGIKEFKINTVNGRWVEFRKPARPPR